MPWHTDRLTADEWREIIKDQDARHKAMRDEQRRQRRTGRG